MKTTHQNRQNLPNQPNRETQLEHIRRTLKYLVAEGIAEEVNLGEYQLTKEGKKLVETTV